MKSRCVTTIAVGKRYYYLLAKNLLRSFLIHNDPKKISFQVLTDNNNEFDEFAGIDGVSVILLRDLEPNERAFTSKFKLAQFIAAEQNLFVDCDCLIYKSLDQVFDSFRGRDFSVIGESLIDGEFFGNIAQVRRKFNLEHLVYFVGSVYYYSNTATTKQIFQSAKDLLGTYDSLGLVRLMGKENEEPLLSIAMSLYQQVPLPDDGTVKVDCMNLYSFNTNVLSGALRLKSKNNIKYNPAIVHFNGRYSEHYMYLAEAYRLKNADRSWLIREVYPTIVYKLPQLMQNEMKSTFRPIYRSVFGVSKIKPSNRT